MHELSICQALMEQVGKIARDENADRVSAVHLQIGPLSGVETTQLENAFYIAAAGSVASAAELVITSMPVRVSCDSCGKVSDVLPGRLLCGHCGDWHTRLISGDELCLSRIELDRDTDTTASTGHEPAEQERFG